MRHPAPTPCPWGPLPSLLLRLALALSLSLFFGSSPPALRRRCSASTSPGRTVPKRPLNVTSDANRVTLAHEEPLSLSRTSSSQAAGGRVSPSPPGSPDPARWMCAVHGYRRPPTSFLFRQRWGSRKVLPLLSSLPTCRVCLAAFSSPVHAMSYSLVELSSRPPDPRACTYCVSLPTLNCTGPPDLSARDFLTRRARGQSALPLGLDPVRCGAVSSWLDVWMMLMSPLSPCFFQPPLGGCGDTFGVPGTRLRASKSVLIHFLHDYKSVPANTLRTWHLSACPAADMCMPLVPSNKVVDP